MTWWNVTVDYKVNSMDHSEVKRVTLADIQGPDLQDVYAKLVNCGDVIRSLGGVRCLIHPRRTNKIN